MLCGKVGGGYINIYEFIDNYKYIFKYVFTSRVI